MPNNNISNTGDESETLNVNNNQLELGNPEAKLTVLEFSDFQCPFCERFYKETYGQIITNYVDTGKIKFVYKNFPLTNIHPKAFNAALGYECAVEQGKGSEFHNILFEGRKLDVADLKLTASALSLDTTKFNDCLDSKKYEQKVQDDMKEGRDKGVSGTPTLFIGDTKIVGAQPFSVIKKEIDKQLNALG